MKSINRVRLRVKREHTDVDYYRRVTNSANVAKVAESLLNEEAQEVVLAFHIDNRNNIIGYTEVSRGAIDATALTARETFRAAIVNGASAIILAHNHPSGVSAPSREDNLITERLHKAGELLGIELLDHVIVAPGAAYHSYMDLGLLKRSPTPICIAAE